MIEVRHRHTGSVLLRATAETLNGKKLCKMDLTGANLSARDLCYTNFREAILRLVDFRESKCCNCLLDKASCEDADFSRADLSSASLLGTRLRNAGFVGTILRYAICAGADFQHADLRGADLSMSDLRANLREADLTGADLRGANLSGANLQLANLSGANLTSANLAGVNLVGAKLENATMDRGASGSVRTILTAAPFSQRRQERSGPKSALPVDFSRPGIRAPKQRGNRASAEMSPFERKPAGGAADAAAVPGPIENPRDPGLLAKWKNCLRVRLLGGGQAKDVPLKPGTEGVVIEFFSHHGDDFWLVDFQMQGTLNVPRGALEILDPDFFSDGRQQQLSLESRLLENAKEAVVYSTNRGKFKSLVVWYAGGRYQVIEEAHRAERLLELCKWRRIPVSKDQWFD